MAEPLPLSTGIERVWVNGQAVWASGRATQVSSGRLLCAQ